MSYDFFWGSLFGCGLSLLIGLAWMALARRTPSKPPPPTRDPADWWKDA